MTSRQLKTITVKKKVRIKKVSRCFIPTVHKSRQTFIKDQRCQRDYGTFSKILLLTQEAGRAFQDEFKDLISGSESVTFICCGTSDISISKKV